MNCIVALIQNPEKQLAVHAELDAILGDRLPTIADRKSTHYLNAVIKETLRWRPSLPLG
jgi:cytochrome P450